jgi:deazaflavin-dependent oxidoreductase (nitroreductase family)
MDAGEPILDPTTDWVARHLRDYVQTGGEKGHIWRGVPTLLLTTRGRRSGSLRRTPLIYGRSGDAYVVVGSRGGHPRDPSWFLNLRDEPEVTIQVGSDVGDARARIAHGDERERLWAEMVAIWPDYERYRARTDREIPVVVLEPVG